MLGEKLEKLVRESGVDLSEVAAALGIQKPNLYKLYKRKSFDVSYIIKSCEFFKVPFSYFLDKKDLRIIEFEDLEQRNELREIKTEIESIKKDNASLERENTLLREMIEILRMNLESKPDEKKTPERTRTRNNSPQYLPQNR